MVFTAKNCCRHRYSKTLVACICILLALTALANLWGVPSINNHLLPQATQTACAVLDREVRALDNREHLRKQTDAVQ